MHSRKSCALIAFVAATLCLPAARASFHFMQIEQVIGGVSGDTTAQAIQLRMRFAGQNLVSSAHLRVFDAAGLNPITVCDMTMNVSNSAAGARILIASANFPAHTLPPATLNFTMSNLIPASYLNAGSLVFEQDGVNTVYWRLSWGGAGYTGSNSGNIANDADGNFGPPWPGPLPSSDARALRFTGTAGAMSTNNAADYALTTGAATFVNNAGNSFVVQQPAQPTPGDMNCDGTVDNADIDSFVQALTDPAGYVADHPDCDINNADVNDDGSVDNGDIDAFVALLLG